MVDRRSVFDVLFLVEAVQTLECGDEGQILWGGGGLDEEIDEIGHEAYDESTDEYMPNWAAVAFDAIKASRAAPT